MVSSPDEKHKWQGGKQTRGYPAGCNNPSSFFSLLGTDALL